MKVLSLFDGISCGKVALERAGIKVDKYYASEIDRYAVAVSKYQHPDIIHLGDVRQIFVCPDKIDLLLGGPPCQDLSISKRNRQGLKGERSSLFWDFVRMLDKCKPKYFLMENVASMKKTDRDFISSVLGVEPIMINSALVSAQQRKRLYWTNIPVKGLPEDKGLVLKDILEDGFTERDKSLCIVASYYKAIPQDYFINSTRQMVFTKPVRIGTIGKGGQGERIYSVDGKSVCLSANGGGRGAKTGLYLIKDYVRKLSPIECERLQTLPDDYTKLGIFEDGKVKQISNTQRYKMLGNAWTVDVIAWMLSFLGRG